MEPEQGGPHPQLVPHGGKHMQLDDGVHAGARVVVEIAGQLTAPRATAAEAECKSRAHKEQPAVRVLHVSYSLSICLLHCLGLPAWFTGSWLALIDS